MTIFQQIYYWAKTMPAENPYKFVSIRECLVGQYCAAQGIKISDPAWRRHFRETHDLELVIKAANNYEFGVLDAPEQTFGAAAARMAQFWPVTP